MVTYKKLLVKDRKKFERKYGAECKAGHYTYRLVWCQDLRDDSRPLCGLCAPQEKVIFIDVSQEDYEETLIHEMYHAEVAESGMRQMPSWNIDIEELCCEIASRVTRHVFKRK